jgi:hypothetical protein
VNQVAEAPDDSDPYERARHDPGFLRAVEATHRGRWPVPDALWWLGHPNDPAPGGTAAPAERVRNLQRRIFAADGDAAGNTAVADALRRLENEIVAERAAIAQAVAAALAGTGPGTEAARPDTAAAEPSALEAGADGAAGAALPALEQAPEPVAEGTPARRWAAAAALVAALLVGAVVGGALNRADRTAAEAPTPATSSATATPPATAPGTAPAGEPVPPLLVAEVFDRAQQPADLPAVPLPRAFDTASFRYLGSAGFTDADGNGVIDSPYYAARGADRMICLVAVPEGSGYLSTCAHEAEYPAAGLRLSWQSTDLLVGASDATAPMVLDITVAWLRDSSIETRGSGRSTVAP